MHHKLPILIFEKDALNKTNISHCNWLPLRRVSNVIILFFSNSDSCTGLTGSIGATIRK